MNIIADDDSILVLFDGTNDNTWNCSGVVRYAPLSGYTVSRPYLMLGHGDNSLLPYSNTTYGSLAGNTNTEGGILIPTTEPGGVGVRPMWMDRLTTSNQSTSYQPANVDGTSRYQETEMVSVVNAIGETNPVFGAIGRPDPTILREIYNVGSADTDTSLTRAFFGGSTALANLKVSVPWDSTTTPRTYATGRTGTSF
jgi:hypothetical protein